MKRPDDRVSKYNGFQIPDYLINRNIEYLVTRTDEITNRQISYITDSLVDSVIIEEYWRQTYRLLGDRFNRSYYLDKLVRITELPLKSDKEDISDKVAISTEISVDLYSQGYLIGECFVNLENGFVSDMSIYIKYNPDDWLDKVYFNHKRTYKSFSKEEENCTIQCEIITPLKYCKSIIRKNFEERLRKWSKRARVICLSMKENIEE